MSRIHKPKLNFVANFPGLHLSPGDVAWQAAKDPKPFAAGIEFYKLVKGGQVVKGVIYVQKYGQDGDGFTPVPAVVEGWTFTRAEVKQLEEFTSRVFNCTLLADPSISDLLAPIISKQWNGAKVENVLVDRDGLSVSATIDGHTNYACGYLEDLFVQAFADYSEAFDRHDPQAPDLMTRAALIKKYLETHPIQNA